MTRQLIRTDGTTIDLPNALPMRKYAELIGADTLDTVSLHHMGEPLHVMLVHDKAWETQEVEHDGWLEIRPIRALLPVNEKATQLYWANCVPGTTHQIAGDVIVAPDDEFAP
jgi:hypothetical protein